MAKLPNQWPITSDELLDELAAQEKPAVVESPAQVYDEGARGELIFQAGRWSIVDELIKIRDRIRSHGV